MTIKNGYWNEATELPEGAVAMDELKVGDRFEIIVRDERFRQLAVVEIPSEENEFCGKLKIIEGPLYDHNRDYDLIDKGYFSCFFQSREAALDHYVKYGTYQIRIT